MAIFMRSLYVLLTSTFIFNAQAMHTSSAQVAQWAEKNKTPLVAGSIVVVGGATAYYLESPKILVASVVGAGVYVACHSWCNDDEFQKRLQALSEQNAQIEDQYKILNSGIDALLKEQKNITASAVKVGGAAVKVDDKVTAMIQAVDQVLDTNFLQEAKNIPVVTEEVKSEVAKNVAMCNNIHAHAEEIKKEADAFDAALENLVRAGKEAEMGLSKRMNDRTERTSKLVAQGAADILKLLEDHSVQGKLSDSY